MSVKKIVYAMSKTPPEDIAQTLRDAGIKGRRGNPSFCPLALYLKRETATAFVLVGPNWIRYSHRKGVDCVLTPKTVRQFLEYFDQGLLPTLVGDPMNEPL